MITVTKTAANVIKEMIEKQSEKVYFRIGIKQLGCNGFSYHLALDANQAECDMVFEQYGVPIIVDSTLEEYLKGVSIDYKETRTAKGLIINNPNVSGSCSCGNSFNVTGQDAPIREFGGESVMCKSAISQ